MKNTSLLFGTMLLVGLAFSGCKKEQIESYSNPVNDPSLKNTPCTTIQSGLLLDSDGNVILPGFNSATNYNYQAHLYNGDYYNNGGHLIMKWNDAWLSNQDCDGDLKLDRHYGSPSYIGSGAWLTNHYKETYLDEDGNECKYSEFIKIVAAPADATLTAGIWYDVDGNEIGEEIWGDFAIIQYIINDPCEGLGGVFYKSPDHAGLGNW